MYIIYIYIHIYIYIYLYIYIMFADWPRTLKSTLLSRCFLSRRGRAGVLAGRPARSSEFAAYALPWVQ